MSANPNAPGEEREPARLSRTGTLVVVDDEPLHAARAVRAPDPFVPYTVCAVELESSRWSCSASSPPAPTPSQLEVGMAMELVLGPLYEDDEHEYVVWQWAPRRAVE